MKEIKIFHCSKCNNHRNAIYGWGSVQRTITYWKTVKGFRTYCKFCGRVISEIAEKKDTVHQKQA